MSTAAFGQTAAYYHVSPVNSDAATAWIPGGPRKGIADGQRHIGMVMFDNAAIAAAIGSSTVPEARLILTRDATYGTDNVDICLAPFVTDEPPSINTYAQCMGRAQRRFHYYTTVSGNLSTIKLPGYWLQMMRQGQFAGVIIYQEAGEATDAHARFTEAARLEVDRESNWKTPVWMRPIGKGDVISDDSHSLKGDMSELMHYVNIRLALDGLDTIDWDEPTPLENGLYKDWPAAVRRMQDAICDQPMTSASIYGHEGKTAITWKRAGNIGTVHSDSNIILPNAEIINQIRNALEAPTSGGGTKETIAVPGTAYARTYFDHYGGDFTVNLNSPTTWASGRAPMSGMNWEYTTERGTKEKKYNRRFGFWLLADLTDWSAVSNAKLRVTRSEGNKGTFQITLYPVNIASMPSVKKSVSEVFVDQTTICGTATASIGQTVDIALSDATIAALADGTYTGVGVNDHDNWTNFAASATLIINEEEE